MRVDSDKLSPGDELQWVDALHRPRRELEKGDLTVALQTYRDEWKVPEGPDRISVNPRCAFLASEAEGIAFRTWPGVSTWAISLRYPGKPVTATMASATKPLMTLRFVDELPPDQEEMLLLGHTVIAPKAVSKIEPHHRRARRGRPRAAVPEQMSLADQKGLSLRKRGVLLGISAATVLRRDREAARNGPAKETSV